MKQRRFLDFVQTYFLPKHCSLWLGATLLGCASGQAQPTNDNFAARAPLFGEEVVISTSLAGATSEAAEPLLPGVSSGQTAWWTWTAPSNGIASLALGGAQFKPLFTIFTGDTLETLSLIASNNYFGCYPNTNCGCHWRVREWVTFHVTAGQTYQIAADSAITTDATTTGNFSHSITTNVAPGSNLYMVLRFTPAPENDDFDGRIMLTGSRTHLYCDNYGAGRQTGEPNHLGNPGGSSVWYSWTAPDSGRVTLSANEIPPYGPPTWAGDNTLLRGLTAICGVFSEVNPLPSFFPVFAAYTGNSVESLTPENCLPMNLDAYPNGVEFDAVKGETYQIAFDGNMGTIGSTPLYLALTMPARNDSFSRRIQIRGAYITATGHNAGATRQTGEPAAGTNSVGKTVWWTWKAPASGTTSIDLSQSDYPFPVSVFCGNTVSNLQLVAQGNGAVSFQAAEWVSYQIAVSDAAGLTGAIKMRVQAPLVEARLLQVVGSGNTGVLLFGAQPGQVLLLMRSTDGLDWQNVSTATAHRNTVTFVVHPAPLARGPHYRAIVIDRVF